MGFFKSFFSGKPANPEEEKQKNNQKNFEIFKYDGMRAQRMGRADYAIKCFTEALALQEDFETMGYLAQVYIQSNELDEARKLLERMIRTEPEHTSTLLTLANVCYMQEDYAAMAEAAQKAIAVEEGNAMAHYLLGKADNGQNDGIMHRPPHKSHRTQGRLHRSPSAACRGSDKDAAVQRGHGRHRRHTRPRPGR